MSYKHKYEIIMNLKDYHAGRRVVTGGTNAFESKLSELDHVYAQAPKADEYEAKAKAFDEIMFTVKNVKRDTPFNTTVRNIVRQYEKEYESGESE